VKKYPSWQDFKSDDIMYGVGAPFVGIGVYTFDRKFSWPDRQGTRKDEYEGWVNWLEAQGYEIPKEYENAYVEFNPS